MKKLFFLALILVTLSCKNKDKPNKVISSENIERTQKQSDGLTLLKGEFVYYADAAVLQTHAEIYGVILNDMVDELNKKAKPLKTQPTDFVWVEVRGKITQKPEDEEGWDNRVEIKEILNVSALKNKSNNIIKSGKQ